MIKEDDTNDGYPCPCYKKCTDCPKVFEKIMDIKNAGLVIYRYSVKSEQENRIIETGGSDIDESGFIFHNTKDEDIASKDFLPQIEQWAKWAKAKCVRCRQIMKHAINILQKVSAISKNEIIGICAHCRLKDQPCVECEVALKTFFETKQDAKKIGLDKERIKKCLKNVQSEIKTYFEDEKETDKEYLKDYVEKYKGTGKIKLRAHSAERINQLCRIGHDRSERELKIRELRLSEQQDLANHSGIITDKSKKRMLFNFDKLEVVDSTSMISLDRKTKSAVLKTKKPLTWTIISKKDRDSKNDNRFMISSDKKIKSVVPETEQSSAVPKRPSTWNIDQIRILPKKEIGSKNDDRFIKGKLPRSPKIQGRDYSEEDILPVHYRIHDTEKVGSFIEEPSEEKLRTDFIFSFPALKKDEKFEQLKSSSELIGDIYDRIREKNEEIRQKQEMIRLKKLEEEEKRKKRAQQKKLKLADEKQRLEEEKQRLNKELLANIKEHNNFKDSGLYKKKEDKGSLNDKIEAAQKGLDLKSNSHLSKSGSKQFKTKESKGQLKSSSDKSLKDNKNNSASSKIEQKKPIGGPKGEPKQKNELKHSKSEPQIDLKQTKTRAKDESKESKAESKQHDSESKSALIEAQSKDSEVESKDTQTEQIHSKAKSSIPKHPEKHNKESKDSKIKSGSKSAPELKESSVDKSNKKKGKMYSDKAKVEKDSTTQKRKENTYKDEESVIKYGKERGIKSSEEPRVSRREVEAQLKTAQEERTRKTRQELKPTSIEMLKDSQDLMILGLVKVKDSAKQTPSQIMTPSKMQLHSREHRFIKGHSCPLCMNSDLDLEYECRMKHKMEPPEMIAGCKIIHTHSYSEEKEDSGVKPILFQYKCDDDMQSPRKVPVAREYLEKIKPTKTLPNEEPKGVICYTLSDRTFIEKGWTMLPTEKIVRKMNVYRMRPAHPEFDWFVRNRSKRLLTYDSGERFAEFDDDGHGRWFYRNQRLALQYYDAEELNAQQRYVIYSNGEPDERGRTRPYTVLAMFDFLGNGVVFDHGGKIRMKYNQTEGVILDKSIGPVSHWQWHTLNDPPVLQQVMIDTHMAHKDPDIIKLTTPVEKQRQPDNEDMLAIEFDNFVKEKSKKLTQKFKPFQIKMKALKINENFSLKVLDQANVYLIYRDGTTNIKLNLGMLLDHKEIVDTDTAELGEVASNMERLPARTGSLAALQRSVAYAQHFEKTRTKRELILRPPEPSASADQLAAAASRPMRRPLRAARSSTATNSCYKSMKPSSNNIYYDNRLC